MLGLRIALSVAKGVIDEIGGLLSKLARRSTYSENLADSRAIVSDIDSYDLLDKATILLTPTATSDARIHSVKTYTGDELVDDGNFELTGTQAESVAGTYWTTGSDWSIANGKLTGSGDTSYSASQQTISGLSGKKIKVTFEIADWVSGTFRVPPSDRLDGLDERYSGDGFVYQLFEFAL